MDGSSSKFGLRPLTGKCYDTWSKKMMKQLIFKGLWPIVERGYENHPKERLDSQEMEILQNAMTNDAKALSLIRQSLSPPIFMKVVDAQTAKETWDRLHFMLGKKGTSKMEEAPNVQETTYESTNAPDDNLSVTHAKKSSKSLAANEMPLSGDKPFFDICLAKSAVQPTCLLTFPNDVSEMLPTKHVMAEVKCFGKIYLINFCGNLKQKSFGSGWRQVVFDHGLSEGDFVVFEIVESSNSRLEINLQVLRNIIPPELEDEIQKGG